MHVLGLMSGTSADGVDAVLARFKGSPRRPEWELISSSSMPYPTALQEQIVAIGQGQPQPSEALLNLAEEITEIHAEAAQSCDPRSLATLVGCHGQTLWHRPPNQDPTGHRLRGASWQLLQAPLLATLLNRSVVHDFRAADLALGGQGAPLVPMADAALVGPAPGWRALLNLGGIANLTLIPPAQGPDRGADVLGWDCGPANTLIDLAVGHFSGGRERFDLNGRRAAAGHVCEEVLARWVQEPYFQQSPPKSTGREWFGQDNLHARLAQLEGQRADDCIATLTAFTAAVVAQDLDQLQRHALPRPLELVVAGGGCRNLELMRQLQQRCRGVRVRKSDTLGLPAESREALVFALLAWWHDRQVPGNAPAVTGASRACVLGTRVDPPRR